MVPFHCFPANVLCSPPTMMSSSYADKIAAAEKDSIMHVFSLTCDWLCSGNWWSSSYACTRPRQWTHHGQRQVCAEKAWSYMGDPHKQPRKCAAHTQCCLGEFVIFFRLGRGAPLPSFALPSWVNSKRKFLAGHVTRSHILLSTTSAAAQCTTVLASCGCCYYQVLASHKIVTATVLHCGYSCFHPVRINHNH